MDLERLPPNPPTPIPPAWTEAAAGCFACGRENPEGLHLEVQFGDGWSRCDTSLRPTHAGWPGIAHGGMVTTLLDEIMSYAVIGPEQLFTAEITVRYLRPVPVGQPLRLEGRRLRAKGRLREAEGVILNADGVVLAKGTAKFLLASPPSAPTPG